MKRLLILFFTCLLLMIISYTGCGKVSVITNSPSITPTNSVSDTQDTDITPTITSAPNNYVINVYSNTDEVPKMVQRYKELHPDFPYKIQVYLTPDVAFTICLDDALATGGAYTPDIYCVEQQDAMKYSHEDKAKYAAPYEELGIDVSKLINEADIAPYSIDVGTNPDGKLVGLSYQGTGGAFIYRRSIAKSVWGTDDPANIQDKIGPGWDKFFHAAADLKAKGYGIVSGISDIWHAIDCSADQPWVVDGKLFIDPKREAFLDMAKHLIDKGYSNNTQDWTDDWYSDMEGTGKKQILGFFGPAWLVNYVMKDRSGGDKIGEGTYGDWAICEPPVSFFWGGTWIFANKNSTHKDVIGDIIKWITLDSSDTGLQNYWANGSWIGANGVPDAVISGTVMKKSDGKLDFLGGQNMFDVFCKAGRLASGKNKTQYDEQIYHCWLEQVREYASGNKTREQAIADFKHEVKLQLHIIVD